MPDDSKFDSLLESLETGHTFPGSYTFKVIGRNPDSFARTVIMAVAEELSLEHEPPHSAKQTPNGRHISITLTLTVETPQHIIKVYQRLQTLDDLIILL